MTNMKLVNYTESFSQTQIKCKIEVKLNSVLTSEHLKIRFLDSEKSFRLTVKRSDGKYLKPKLDNLLNTVPALKAEIHLYDNNGQHLDQVMEKTQVFLPGGTIKFEKLQIGNNNFRSLKLVLNLTVYSGNLIDKASREDENTHIADIIRTDFKVICKNNTVIPCHKRVLAKQSIYVQLMDRLLFNDWTDNELNTLKINDFDTRTVENMVHFMYCGKLPENRNCSLDLLHISVKYGIENLFEFCELELANNINSKNCKKFLKVADQIGANLLRHSSLAYISGNPQHSKATRNWKKFVAGDAKLIKEINHRSNLSSQ